MKIIKQLQGQKEQLSGRTSCLRPKVKKPEPLKTRVRELEDEDAHTRLCSPFQIDSIALRKNQKLRRLWLMKADLKKRWLLAILCG